MAFCNRLGSLMKHTISQTSVSNGQVPMASMLNAIRCMSSSKLFVGGLSYGVNDESLRDAFSSFGDVTEARVIIDRDSGRSRGFGFVNFSNDECASSALAGMDGQPLDGRNIRVSYAQDRAGPPRDNFGGGSSYRGGYGDSGGNDRF